MCRLAKFRCYFTKIGKEQKLENAFFLLRITADYSGFCLSFIEDLIRDHFVYAPSQWVMMLQCNIVSNWLGAYIKLYLLYLDDLMQKWRNSIAIELLCLYVSHDERYTNKMLRTLIDFFSLMQKFPKILQGYPQPLVQRMAAQNTAPLQHVSQLKPMYVISVNNIIHF